MPLYLNYLGFSTDQIGLQLALGAVIAVIGQPLFGYVSDRLQSTKKVLIGVMIAGLISGMIYFMLDSFYFVIVSFIILNFFMSASGPLIENLTIAYSQRYNANYGLIRLWGDIGVGTSSVVVAFLISLIGIQYMGAIYIAMLLAGMITALFLQDVERKSKAVISMKSIGQLFSNRNYLWFLFISLIIFTTNRMNDSLLTVYLSNLGATESQIGMAWMLATFASAPLFIVMGKLLKKYSEMVFVSIAAFLYSVRWFLYSWFDDAVVIIYLQLLNGISFPVFIVAALFLVTKIVQDEVIATAQTVYIAVIVGLGGLIGSGGGGWYMESFGPQATYVLGGYITLIGAILSVITLYKQKKQ